MSESSPAGTCPGARGAEAVSGEGLRDSDPPQLQLPAGCSQAEEEQEEDMFLLQR